MSNKILHYQSDNKNDNYAYARCYVEPFKPIDKLKQIGDGTFDLIMKQDISYEGLVKLGTLCDETGEEYPLPVKPWACIDNINVCHNIKGDIPIYNGNKKYIGDTSKNQKNILQWHKFLNKNKYIYICDRCILSGCTIENIDKMGLLNKIIKIDGKFYLCRVLTDTEYNKYILNTEGIQQVPYTENRFLNQYYFKNSKILKDLEFIPKEELEKFCNDDSEKKEIDKTNDFWNYYGIYTQCFENNICHYIGYYTADNVIGVSDIDINIIGWRPVLEEIEYKFINVLLKNEIYCSDNTVNLNKIKDIEKNNKSIRIL